jgi:hypothetical protein
MTISAIRIMVGWLVLGAVSCLALAQESPRYIETEAYQTPAALAEEASKEIVITYTVREPHYEQITSPNRETKTIVRYVAKTETAHVALNGDLDALDLPPDGKRAAVLAITAARHDGLLEKLKGAEGDEEKETAFELLTDNYVRHYAIETWWREQKLADLEKKLKELRDQVKQRNDSQEKSVTAAMTIAQLWADGIGIAPPKPTIASTSGSLRGTNWPLSVRPQFFGEEPTQYRPSLAPPAIQTPHFAPQQPQGVPTLQSRTRLSGPTAPQRDG